MARMYKVSADVSEKEKAVGGIMTFGQAGWLVLGFLICAGLFLLLAGAFVWGIPAAGKYPSARPGADSWASAWDWVWVYLRLLQEGRTPAFHLHPLQEVF